ncbi:MAG: FliM/FliN family flagellar motor switch protein [Ilumatobacter sp.]|uniref:flagellar motor switch protein FliM n=1 Tax=Ilumatobacter sp. TaxID=1967498 RepID=UPI00262A5381|nr:FliM/FliN family flagellar motor switch protein [Ilumatobacter sp.]MDJ0767465.1 FliM/FliN family flagellar motor switch protein [Ilumatobacter sp.]
MSTATSSAAKRSAGGRVRGPGEVRPFDFRRPSTLPREHVRTIQIAQESMARGFTTALAASLRAVTEVSIRDFEQCTYDEYARTIDNPTALTMLSFQSRRASAMLEIPLRVAFGAVELLLGGLGGDEQPARPMTELELGLLHGVVDELLPEIRTALQPIMAIEPMILGQESNPQFAQLAAPNEMVIVMSFEIRLEAVTDVVRLCVPFGLLLPHLDHLTRGPTDPSASAVAEEQARLHDALVSAPVAVAATFRPAVASSREIVSLQVGDVLMLPHPTSAPLSLEVDGVAVHEATIGRVNRQTALQVGAPAAPGQTRRPSRVQIVKRA